MKSRRSHLFCFGLVGLTIVGCNSILDNKPGTLKQSTDVEGNQPAKPTPTPGTENPPSSSSSSGGEVVVTPPTPPSATGECTDGKVLCNGQCVSKDDPAYGCGACAPPCAVTHGSAQCVAGACAVKVCDRGYSDCDGKPDNGCETDLSKATSCGSCNAVCPAATPVCAPSGDTFQCGTGCAPVAPLLCGTECVEPNTSVNHCGGCGLKCPEVANGETNCTLGHCGFTCRPTFHACGTKCAAASDVTACGPQCEVCPTPANATPSCTDDKCGFVCAAGFGDCNQNAADGCELPLANDPVNCGACGNDCHGGTCTNGVCSAPPPDAGAEPPPP